jgi:hypothetical protein
MDGDVLDIDYIPSNYVRTVAPAQVTSLEELTAHLAGIDAAIAAPVPGAHAASHENGGPDEIDLSGLSGLLADDQNPTVHALGGTKHSASTLAALNALVTGATLDDSGDSRPPLAHASDHIRGGSDEIDGDVLDIDYTPANYTRTVAPAEVTNVEELTAHLAGIDAALAGTGLHAATHLSGAADEVDGDKLDITWNPSNYTPATTPVEVTSVDELTAHLYGIDQVLAGPFTPSSHASTHENGGADEISVAGLSGLLADPQTPTSHASSHENGGADEIDVGGLSGLLADPQTPLSHASGHASGGADEVDGDTIDIDWNPTNYTPATTPVEVTSIDELTAHLYGIDQVLAGPFTPASHASTHENGGADEIDVGGLSGLLADSQTPLAHVSTHANGGADELDVGGLSGLLADAQTPLGHASTHVSGGADEIDGDVLDIDWNPSNYTPATTPAEVTSVDELTAHLYGIDVSLGAALALNVQDVYDNTGGALHITLVAAQPFTIRDAVAPIGDLLKLQDGTGTDFFTVDPSMLEYGPPTRRIIEVNELSTSIGGIRYFPDGGTITSDVGKQAAIQWDSVVTTNIPGGAPFGNDTAPAMIQSTGEIIFLDQAFLFATSLLFNQGTTVSASLGNLGPIYTMVHQPKIRSVSAGAKTCSQMNAVRAQPGIGPNTAGSITQVSTELFFATILVNGTTGAATATTVEYFAAQAPTLTAGGTIGTLDVLKIENIPAAGITTLRGIHSLMVAGTFIYHVGTAPSQFGGALLLGAGATADWQISRAAANRADIASGDSLRFVSGSLQFSTDITIDRPATGSLHVDAPVIALLPGATPTGSDNWMLSVNPAARTTQVDGEWTDVLFTAANTLTVNDTMSAVSGWKVNAPSIALGTGSVVDAMAMLITGNVAVGTNRYGLHVQSNPSGGTLNYCARFSGAAGVRIDGVLTHQGSTLGFYGATPVARQTYTPTNVTTDRSFDANATTLDELADVVGTLIADLQAVGLAA